MTEKDQLKAELRSTERCQTIMRLIRSQNPPPETDEKQDMQRGYLGPCLLVDLEFFDQGQSFMSDSLHTLYGGAMVSRVISVFRQAHDSELAFSCLCRRSYCHFVLIENGELKKNYGRLNRK